MNKRNESFNATNITIGSGLAPSTCSANLDGIEFAEIKVAADMTPNCVITYANNAWRKGGATAQRVDTIVNAVDIDWNGAVIPNGDLANGTSRTIYSTGDLFTVINDMQAEIYVLAAAVSALAVKS